MVEKKMGIMFIKSKKVLDQGEIALLEFMGSDKEIVDSARISYSQKTKVKTKTNDEILMRYLMRHGHMTPFEMAELKFYVKAPIFVFRQWHRHRTANINEMSGRYSELSNDFYTPLKLRLQIKDNKQGSTNQTISYSFNSFDKSFTEYQSLLNKGVTREQARIVLPLAVYSEMYWKCDLRNIFNFLKLRLDSHAQYEIREYAIAMSILVKEQFPLAYSAFKNYMLESITLSADEIESIRTKVHKLSGREQKEFKFKLKRLGLDGAVL